MRPHVLSRSPLTLVALFAIAAQASGQEMQLASRPRFLAVLPHSDRRVDASNAATLRRRVSIDLDGATVGTLLKEIARQADLELLYSEAIVPASRPVTLHAQGITVAAALTEVLLDTGLDVLVSPTGQMALVQKAADVAQGGTVTGRVTDAKSGRAIPNVLVYLEGTRWRATTGEDGAYRLADVAAGTHTLTASRIGYAKQSQSVTVAAGQEVTVDVALSAAATELEQVVVTGTVVPTERKAVPTPISVITADQIAQKGYQQVDQIFRGDVPGALAWDQGPLNYYSTVFVRGASSLGGSSSVKTFIDGVEMVGGEGVFPFWIATIDPHSIDRIEITRGPQASTLYGAGALSGVMQIFTKKGQVGLTRPEFTATLSAGDVGGFDGQSSALQTDNTLSVVGGGEKTSYNLGASYRHVGDWAPSYRSTDWGLSAGSQTTQGPFTLSGSARYADKTFDFPWDTRLQGYSFWSKPFYETDRVRQQTFGATASFQATRAWQHTLTLGYDQNYYTYNQTQPRFTSPADSFLYVLANHQAKTSLLYHSDLNLKVAPSVATTLTAGVNYDGYDQFYSYTYNATRTTGSLNGTTFALRTPWTNTGYFGQVQVQIAERLFLTGGLRAERNPNFGAAVGTAWSPRVGAAYVVGLGPTTMKLRASYGEGIRAPDPAQRNPPPIPGVAYLANPLLGPERQRGADGGVEVYVGRVFLGVSYYSQRAIDLIQNVNVTSPADTLPTYQYQNIARVKNEGWEFEAHLPVGPVQLAGTYSITTSTVQQLPPGYPAGGYQVGDRILAVPHTVAGATVTYSPLPQTTLTATMTHIGHWIEHDNLALYGYYSGTVPYRGSDRAYWMEYPTVTKFAVGVSHGLTKDVTAFARAENVGNTLRAEQTNSQIPKPRSVTIGASLRY